jgi:hypothetical protein
LEEIEILIEEQQRALLWHQKTAAIWGKLAEEDAQSAGSKAYAYRQQDVHTKFALKIQKEWEIAKVFLSRVLLSSIFIMRSEWFTEEWTIHS